MRDLLSSVTGQAAVHRSRSHQERPFVCQRSALCALQFGPRPIRRVDGSDSSCGSLSGARPDSLDEIPQAQRVRLTKYDLTVRRYSALLVAQDHRCAICLRPQEKPYVDHCHRTQRVRGLLCLPGDRITGGLARAGEASYRVLEAIQRVVRRWAMPSGLY